MACESCGEKPKKCNKDFTKAVIEINNPEQITLMRKVTIPASMGDDTTVPPVVGKYKNVLLFYEANSKSYLYSSDGIPTLLANGLTDYEQAVNLPQINGVTLTGDKTATQLGLQDKLTAGDNISIDANNVISAVDTTYGPATDSTIGLVKPGDGLEVDASGTMSISDIEQYAQFFDTVADMKAATNLVNGDYARTLGFHTINDGGDAIYYVREVTAQDVIDEGKLIALNNQTLVAELIIENNVIDVKKFGAWADGVHDDSDVFQHCLDLVNITSSSTGTWKRTIVVPAVLRITKKIECEFGNFRMEGVSRTNSKILLDSANAYLSFGKNSGTIYEIEIQNITFQGNYSNSNPLLSFTKCVNLYLTRIDTENQGQDIYGIEFDQCGLIFMDKCTITGSNDLVNYPGNRNGIKVTQINSIFNFTNTNCWNLNKVFTFVGSVQNINIENNWIECYKSLIDFDCATSGMSYMNVKICNNTLSTHHSDNFTPTSISFISYDMKNATNLYGGTLDVSNNTIMFGNLTSINNNTLIYFNSIGDSANSTFSVYFDRNVFGWQQLNTLNAYVFYNSDSSFYTGNFIQIKSFDANVNTDTNRVTDERTIVKCCLHESSKAYPSYPNGIYLNKTFTANHGNIYYANGDFYAGYAGTIKALPKNVGTAIPLADSTNVVDIVNQIRTALSQAHITTMG